MPQVISDLYEFGEFRLDAQKRVLRRGGEVVPLTPKALEVLLTLVQRAGEVVTKDALIKAVWLDSFVEESNLTQTIFMIRKALGETVDQRYILTVPGMGYRFLTPVTGAANGGSEAAVLPPQTSQVGDSNLEQERSNWHRVLIACAVSIALVLGLGLWVWRSRQRPSEVPSRIMLAVLPFQNLTGDASQEYFSDGLTEEMLTQLGNFDPEHLGVIARTSVMRYKGSQAPIDQIGRELGVQYVIEGSVRRDASRVRISAQLIQIKDQSHLWAREYDHELKDLLGLQSEIAQEIIEEIPLTLRGQPRASAIRRSSATISYDAYDLYLKGLYFWNKRTGDGFRQAADSFQQAIAKDPNYARAYAGLASTYGLMSTWMQGPANELMPKARSAALKALQLDDTLPEAHTAMALVAESYDYDWQMAEKEFRMAIELDPNYATAHQWYGEYLSWMGRFDQALAESDQARKLDPLSLIIASDHGAVLYRARQYDRAIAQYRAVLEMDPQFLHSFDSLMMSYIRTGRFTEALDEINRYIRPLSPLWASANEAIVYAEWGRIMESNRALVRFEELVRNGNDARLKMKVYIATGQNDKALALLQTFFAERSHIIPTLKTDPTYDPLRGDPRFQNLLRQVHLAD